MQILDRETGMMAMHKTTQFFLAIMLIFFLAAAANAQPTGYAAYYEFNNTLDSSTNANNGSLNSGAAIASDTTRGNVLSLNGTGAYFEAPNTTSLNISGNQITLAAWVNFTNNGNAQMIIAKPFSATSHSTPYFQYAIYLMPISGSTAMKPSFSLNLNGTWIYPEPNSASITQGTWHHIVGTYDGTTMRIYVNGTQVNSKTTSGNISPYNTPLRIGTNGGLGEYFNGKIDSILIYPRALSSSEITTLYNLSPGEQCSGTTNSCGTYPNCLTCGTGQNCCGNSCTTPNCTSTSGCGTAQTCANAGTCTAACQNIVCGQGAITSECYCGSTVQTNGYCCGGTYQTTACAATSCTKYVSANGNGTTCSAANPCKINDAKKNASAGDTFCLLPGEYGSVTFGETGDKYGNSSSGYITYMSDPASPAYSAKFNYIGFIGANNFYIKIKGFDIFVPATTSYGILIEGTDSVRSNYIHIDDCKVHGSQGSINFSKGPITCIYGTNSNNILIENSEVYYPGYSSGGGDGIWFWKCANVTVRSNLVHDIISSGISSNGDGPYLFENNIIHSQRPEWSPGNEAHGSGFAIRSNLVTIRGNTIYDYGNTRPIRWYQNIVRFTGGYHDCLVENNLVFYTSAWTTYWLPLEVVDAGDNFVIRNNTVMTGGLRVDIVENKDGSGLSIYNNVVLHSMTVNNFSSYSDDAAAAALFAQTCAQANTKWANVKEGNNIVKSFIAGGNGSGVGCEYPYFSTTSTSIKNTDFGVGSFFSTGNNIYPFSAGYPYQLAAGSKAIGFANPTQAPAIDLLGKARDSSPDAGAYEFQSTTPCTQTQLTNYLSQWKAGTLQMATLMQKIAAWKAGQAC